MTDTQDFSIAVFCFWQKRKPESKEWFITADELGAQKLLDMLSQLQNHTGGDKRVILLNSDPEESRIEGNPHRAVMMKKLTLFVIRNPHAPNLAIVENEEHITFEFTPETIPDLIEGISDIAKGYAAATLPGFGVDLTFTK